MMVTFISQCEKRALKKTRRVLDAFANRIGDNTWQTVITEEGLKTVKKNLRRTASKSTAVSCHWIRNRSRSQFLWVVGNKNKFDEQGVVPVNSTQGDLNHRNWEKGWRKTEVIAVVSGIAGLFHDLGKANKLFQNKLNPETEGRKFEPYRHEWVSLRLFQSFIGEFEDKKWLEKLAVVDASTEYSMRVQIIIDDPQLHEFNNPIENLPALAKAVAWLIVSHHRLPVYPNQGDTEPSLANVDKWPIEAFDPLWNSVNSINHDWDKKSIGGNWSFPEGTPLYSRTWQQKAAHLSKRALRCLGLLDVAWFSQSFVMHLSRLALMLSDHYYSSKPDPILNWQDRGYDCIANTDNHGKPKQKLDEHNVGVAHHAYLIAKSLPRFREKLPHINDDGKVLSKGLGGGKEFQWQDKAYQTAKNLQRAVQTKGFFGINMASTGKGKTITNARIMYGLSGKEDGCRLSIALGLRALTLQTGKSLKERLKLDDGEIATLIGSQAVQHLSQLPSLSDSPLLSARGCESLDVGLDDEGCNVIYESVISQKFLNKWFPNNLKAQKFLHAPLLVSTIDHLTLATEGTRGGRQIVPMLRLLSSDLILDEPDEFNLDDLPALARLVNWAGLLGAKVLLSTATMPPALAYALFEAYQEGRKSFSVATDGQESIKPTVCAWFDEFRSFTVEAQGIQFFIASHDNFVKKRIANLNRETVVLRKAKLISIPLADDHSIDDQFIIKCMARVIQDNMVVLHNEHHQLHESGKRISIGLVRMANINPLIAVARCLYTMASPENHRIHYCVYHSQYPLAQRAFIESKLDQALHRTDAKAIWQIREIKQATTECEERNHLFVVLATSVAEIGRDHDYDWTIAEPSSIRSMIQLAGRMQRHRKKASKTENMYFLAQNFKALRGNNIAYEKPGFEAENRVLCSHDLHNILDKEQYEHPNSIPSIQCKILTARDKRSPLTNLVTMEHLAYREKLLGDNHQENNARLWWTKHAAWCAELQRRQPFRRSTPDQAYCLFYDEAVLEPFWQIKNEHVYPIEYEKISNISTVDIAIGDGNQAWFESDVPTLYEQLSDQFDQPLNYISHCFGEVRLREYPGQVVDWCYSPLLGVFKEI